MERTQAELAEENARLREEKARLLDEIVEYQQASCSYPTEEQLDPEMRLRLMPEDCYERLAEMAAMVGGPRDKVISTDDALDAIESALSKRLMPEGLEWPRFEDGEPVKLGDCVYAPFGSFTAHAIEFASGVYGIKDAPDGDYSTSQNGRIGQPVKRPANTDSWEKWKRDFYARGRDAEEMAERARALAGGANGQ